MINGKLTYRRWLLAFVLVVWAMASAMAQGDMSASVGETRNYSVTDHPGSNYLWRIYRASDLSQPVPPGEASFAGSPSLAAVQVKWHTQGNYLLTVLETDASGCNNTKAIVVTVNSATLNANAGPDVTIGYCQHYQIDGAASTGVGLSYLYTLIDPGGEITNHTQQVSTFVLSPDYPGTLPATFRVRLAVTDRYGNSDSDTIAVTVESKPVAHIALESYINPPDEIMITGTGSSGTALTYLWSTTDGVINSDPTQARVNVAGNATYNLLVTDKYGCSDNFSFRLVYLPSPPPVPPYAVDDTLTLHGYQPTVIRVLDNDLAGDFPIDVSSLTITTIPVYGKAVANSDGTITYTPLVGNSEIDSLVYEICDQKDNCASASVTLLMKLVDLKINQGFSPNGDGKNDTFVIGGIENYPGSEIAIYTRSGQMVYLSDDYKGDWDGKSIRGFFAEGKLVPTGIYYYTLKVAGTDKVIKGYVYITY